MTPPLPSQIGTRKIELLGFSPTSQGWELASSIKSATAWEVWLAYLPKDEEGGSADELDDWLADVITFEDARRVAEEYATTYRCGIEQVPSA
jgi:hypothetical protein